MKIVQTYCKEKFFISTILRPSSCVEFPSEYYETMVFKWDKATKKTIGIIEQHEDRTESQAIETHFLITKQLLDEGEGSNESN